MKDVESRVVVQGVPRGPKGPVMTSGDWKTFKTCGCALFGTSAVLLTVLAACAVGIKIVRWAFS